MSCGCGCTDCGLAALARVYGLRGLTATRATLTRGGLPVRTTATTTEPVEIEVQTQPGYGVPTRVDVVPSRGPMPVRGQPGGFIEDPPLPVPIITTPVYEIPRNSQDVVIPPRPSNDRGNEMPVRTPVSAPVPASTPQTSTSADVSILPGSAAVPVVGTAVNAISKPFPWGLLALTVGGYFLLTSDLLKGGRKR